MPITDGINQDNLKNMRDNAEVACNVLRALGNPNRLIILCLLLEREHTVGELTEVTGMRQTLTSQHLARLRSDKLVKFRRQDQSLFYSIADPVVESLVKVLYENYC